ncbi:putative secreted protein (Por secretion system target) [Chitinophaga niastensis]|uniref:Putative secreted protein (Por secretion system target) n=1 Tax=Chitinophaga niastensis TaxID=536980 RepID=A0A2P8HJL4_CHINA|nr:LamG-like jellyroll fold domain-containing protein [Chitinophaga niastensis]PSL46360.1 putative secreted protein (Por secretion system target) [Chitinophaga niastensis]
MHLNFIPAPTGRRSSCCLLMAPVFLVCFMGLSAHAQTMSHASKVFIRKGIQYQAWMTTDGGTGTPPVTSNINISRSGRYVRVQLAFPNNLSLAEVQVFSGGVNVALNKVTSQSSTVNSGASSRAVDGNTDGNFFNNSVTHTDLQVENWWQADLGQSYVIDSIRIWNRTDCCGDRLRGFYLFVSDNVFSGNTLLSAFSQSGVTAYQMAGGRHYANGAEWDNLNLTAPTYYEEPMYSASFLQQRPNAQWSLAKAPYCTQLSTGPGTIENSSGYLNSLQVANINNLTTVCFGDEEGYSTGLVTQLHDWYALSHSKYPDALVHNNQYIGQWSEANLRTYLQTAQPDLLTYDYYYFYINRSPAPGGSYAAIFQDMYLYRKLALEGYDGTGNSPIGFGYYLQGYKGQNYTYYPSESEFNMGVYAGLLMGAKWLNLFRYEGDPSVFFWLDQNGGLTPQYRQYGSLGKEIKFLSPHLSRLQTTDVRYIAGQNLSGGTAVTNSKPASINVWDTTAGPYITSIAATNLVSATNNGLRGDVIVGYFKPVIGIDTAAGITMAPVPGKSTQYFMIQNGLTISNGCCNGPGTPGIAQDTILGKAALSRQKITLNIDFGNYPVDTLYRVRRSDGQVEMVPLVNVSGSKYNYNDTLDGGKGDLFYWKNADKINAVPPVGTYNAIRLTAGSISAGDVIQLKSKTQYTLEAWVKFNSISSWNTILAKSNTGTDRIALQTGPGNSLYVMTGNGTNAYGQTTSNIINTGQWYHMAVAFDGSQSANAGKLKLYLNGVLQTLTFTGTIPATTSATNAAPLLAGKETTTSTNTYLNGTIDEVRVWDTVLNVTTIAAWKDKAVGSCHPAASRLVVYWQMDDASNSAVATASLGTAYPGTVIAGTYVGGGQAAAVSGCSLLAKIAGTAVSYQDKILPAATADGNNLKVTPNPSSGNSLQVLFKAKQSGQTFITLYNLQGMAVYRKQVAVVKGENNIVMSDLHLNGGLHVVTIQLGRQQLESKVMIVQ